jgi:hypothetical protein
MATDLNGGGCPSLPWKAEVCALSPDYPEPL